MHGLFTAAGCFLFQSTQRFNVKQKNVSLWNNGNKAQ